MKNKYAVSASPSQKQIDDLIRVFNSGRFSEAEKLARSITENSPEHPVGWTILGAILDSTGRESEAEDAKKTAVKLSPLEARAHNNLGVTLKKVGKFLDAEFSFNQAISLKPNYAMAHYNLGNLLVQLGRLEEATSSYAQASSVQPDYYEAFFNLGNTFKKLGRLQEAHTAYTKAISIKPDYMEAYNNLGWLLIEKNDYEGALESFTEHTKLKRDILRTSKEQIPLKISKAKISHDIEQFEFLASRGIESEYLKELSEKYRKIKDQIRWSSDTDLVEINPSQREMLINSARITHIKKADKVKQALNSSLNAEAISERYFKHPFGLTYVDDFLTSGALSALKFFLQESTIWFDVKEGGYLGAYLNEGLASPLLLQIASELKLRFPKIIREHCLTQSWAFKYDSTSNNSGSSATGIQIHADFAAVNVNFWVTPSAANLDPNSGGMIIYNTEAPSEWDFKSYNADKKRILNKLKEGDGEKTKIPYRGNRMVVFNSNLFHETDEYYFMQGYENRRINVTMLFGERES